MRTFAPINTLQSCSHWT